MEISRDLAVTAVTTIADALSISVEEAAEGIIQIVNENMCGALRLVSVEQGYDPARFRADRLRRRGAAACQRAFAG